MTASVDAALEAGDIDEAEWHRRIGEVITHAYLAADTPWGQSGKSGDERAWTQGRSLICDAIHKDGSFLDVGCANGYLMESIYKWSAERGRHVEPYGLDISPELARPRPEPTASLGRENPYRQRPDVAAHPAIRFRAHRAGVRPASPQARPRTATSRRVPRRRRPPYNWRLQRREHRP